jgi:hypothetical protein
MRTQTCVVIRGTIDVVSDPAAASRQADIERKAPGIAARNWNPDRVRRAHVGEVVELSIGDAEHLITIGSGRAVDAPAPAKPVFIVDPQKLRHEV